MSLEWRTRVAGLTFAAFLTGIDQWAKAQVVGPLGPLGLDEVGESITLLPFLALTRTNNYGVSYGMLEATSPEMRWMLVLALLALALEFWWLLRERRGWDIGALALILGGALGNILDRYLFGHVIDFSTSISACTIGRPSISRTFRS